MRSLITSAMVRASRQLAERYIWTHPSIAETFRCRPTYQAVVQEVLAVSHVGRRGRYTAIAGVDRRGNFGG